MPFFYRADTITAGNQGSGCFEDSGDQDRPCKRQGLGANGGANVVGYVVGSDIHRHVAANHRRGNQHVAVRNLVQSHAGRQHDDDDKGQRNPEPEHLWTAKLGGLLNLGNVFYIHACLLKGDWPVRKVKQNCHISLL